ncbi:hypothetical protein ES702_04546 [subsurface metagenome]
MRFLEEVSCLLCLFMRLEESTFSVADFLSATGWVLVTGNGRW